jgi:hypothetical protein
MNGLNPFIPVIRVLFRVLYRLTSGKYTVFSGLVAATPQALKN